MFMIFGLYHLIYIPLMFVNMPNNIDKEAEDNVQLIESSEALRHHQNKSKSQISVFRLMSKLLILV